MPWTQARTIPKWWWQGEVVRRDIYSKIFFKRNYILFVTTQGLSKQYVPHTSQQLLNWRRKNRY